MEVALMGGEWTIEVQPLLARGDWRGTERYEIQSCLGKGGMGVVYRALDRERQQVVALETLLHFEPPALYLFKEEFRPLADVRHTSLVHLYELVVTEGGDVFFTMELVQGTDFRRYVEGEGARGASHPTLTTRVGQPTDSDERDTVRPPSRHAPSPETVVSRPVRADLRRLRPALR